MRLDFYTICVTNEIRRGVPTYTVFPIFKFDAQNDIVCKGGEFYAFWNDNMWSTDIRDLLTIIDNEIMAKAKELRERYPESIIKRRLMNDHNSNVMKEFSQYTKLFPQEDVQFNTRVIFSDEEMVREDYSTNKLSYTPSEGQAPAFDEMFNHIYDPEELEKIMWFIGALLTNNMTNIQKFMYIYGSKGSGKGTVIKLMEMLFEGYYGHISLARLTSGSEFATSQVKELPLLIDSDSKIDRIKDDTNLLKLTSHEALSVNIKHKQLYDVTFKGLLVTASNQRYQVRNVDSGITRRAVVIHPSKRTHETKTYFRLMERIPFELPQIAQRAINVFEKLGPYYYEEFVDVEMATSTDHIYAFVREHHNLLGDPCSLKKASELYKLYLEDIGFETAGYKRKIKEELKRYYSTFSERLRIGEEVMSNMYSGFKYDLVFPDRINVLEESRKKETIDDLEKELGLKIQTSIFDKIASKYPAQYTNDRGTPMYKWDNVKTTLKDIDTKKLHYVQLPSNHIIIDFDIRDDEGNKDLLKNLERAMDFPMTYTELSKSGGGIHLHYIYDGDVSVLEKLYEEEVEIKIFNGNSSLRRRLTKCNDKEIVHISTGLPEKERKQNKMYNDTSVMIWTENKMRKVVENNLKKKYHPNTKPSIDFIVNVFEEAQKQGIKYDLRDMRQDILIFAMRSSNQKDNCLKAISDIVYTTMDEDTQHEIQSLPQKVYKKEELYFFDIEVWSNYFLVIYKKYGETDVTILENPSSEQIENVLKLPLVGFNCRRYDNHILYSALIGSSNLEIYRQSQRIINKDKSAFFGGAYELSYVDIYEFSSKKQSLKKWEVELNIKHDEIEIPWDKPISEDMKERAIEYCTNDVFATEKVFDHISADYEARLIIAELSGLSVNAKTQDHAAEFIFNGDRDPVLSFEYTDLSKEFPTYKYEYGKSTYKGLEINEGGRVVAKPGIYSNVGLFDVTSMHPYSLINLNYFGKYTERFKQLVEARVAVKKKDFKLAGSYLDGALKPYLKDDTADLLAYSLKIIINIVYGMTSASYPNKFKHPDNVDNIVAKRGALFMVDLQEAVEEKGYNVIHVKTDSVKIENVDDEISDFIFEFGKKYGYNFDKEAVYDVVGLVDKANYVTKTGDEYDIVGSVFADPYIFKTLFSKEEIVDRDFAITKEVQNANIYLGESFIGRIAEIYASVSGEEAFRVTDDAEGYVNGTKGYLWKLFSSLTDKKDIDMAFYHAQINKAYDKLTKVGDAILLTDYQPM